MRRATVAAFLAVGLAALLVLPATAWGHGWRGRHHGHHRHHWHPHHHHHHGHYRPRVFLGFGPWWAPPPVVVHRSHVIVEEPPVYIQRDPPDAWWYWCESAGAYYPEVERCAEPWVKVPPRPE